MDRVVVSRSLNPYVNLAFETYLFKSLQPGARLLFLYVNKSCVVIGRNQNPWKEVNLLEAFNHRVPVIRRRSGGGTVVHDEGNVNFCVQTPRNEFSRTKHIDMIVAALKERGQSLRINDRHDILNAAGQKVSGSSYKIERERAYHHATMLLDSNLPLIRSLLHRPSLLGTIRGLGTDSVPSPIANSGISRELYLNTWCDAFNAAYSVSMPPEYVEEKSMVEIDAVQEEIDALKSWQWTFGETPRFFHKINNVEYEVHKGKIVAGPPGSVGKNYKASAVPHETARIIDPSSSRKMHI